MSAPKKIIQLIKRFEEHYDYYTSSEFNEAELRNEFIDPLFKELGWDMKNEQGFAGDYKEVVLEKSLEAEGSKKKPDYSFRTGRGPFDFFVEAKRASLNLEKDRDAAYQIRNYGYSADMPLCILTNFKEFAIYDTRLKPKPKDKAGFKCVEHYSYKQFIEKWDEIKTLFSKEAIKRGSFDKYVKDIKSQKGTIPVDKDFLNTIDEWRLLLARNIALKNQKKITETKLNYAVTKTINRLIFLRICEDRGIERFGHLQEHLENGKIYKSLFKQFLEADDFYDSGLFHFEREKAIKEEPDNLTQTLEIDDKVLRKIIKSLYGQYNFAVMPIEIIGKVYEQFLGKVIRLTKRGAKVEEKPEVKKANGVFYTPIHIVEHIVENSVGKLCQGKKPTDIAKLKILDPACGSASFLLRAYQYLIDWHLAYYLKNSKKYKSKIYKDKNDEWHLYRKEKIRIVLNNIYGVDKDINATEVAKLSLYLKILEGENEQSLKLGAKERALPSLGNNIKNGNSLIEYDYFKGKIDRKSAELKKINPFDWEIEFPIIMKTGRFDAVIGNPPWVSLKGKFANNICSPKELEYLTKKYSGDTYRPNMYEYFVKRAIYLTKKNGFQSFIVPDRLVCNEQFKDFRLELLNSVKIMELLYRADFPGITADTLIYSFRPGFNNQDKNLVNIGDFGEKLQVMRQGDFKKIQDYQFLPLTPLIRKIYFNLKNVKRLDEYVKSQVGFIAKEGKISANKKESSQIPVLKGENILRYHIDGQFYFKFDKMNLAGGTQDKVKLSTAKKIFVKKTGYPLESALDSSGLYPEQSLYFLFDLTGGIELEYLLGIINSNLFQYVYRNWMVTNRDATPQLKKIHLDSFPVRKIDFSKDEDKEKHNQMVDWVKQLIGLRKDLFSLKSEHERDSIRRHINTLERNINNLVYDLYSLKPDEQSIIEEDIGLAMKAQIEYKAPKTRRKEVRREIVRKIKAKRPKKVQPKSNTGDEVRKRRKQ